MMNVKAMGLIGRGTDTLDLGKRTPRGSAQWREYFRKNAAALLRIPWETGVSLTAEEREAISGSIQQFQLGESSDGHHFLYAAREHAAASGDGQYLAALRRFIAEEQRHGGDLGRVMDLAGIARIDHAWADTVFRWMRRRGGLELSISILVTAEIIAQVYYVALREATGSLVLRRLCDQILRDEDEHVRFQCERLATLRQGQWRWSVWFKQFAQRCFFAGTCGVFWMKHAAAMRAGGYGFVSFGRAARRQLKVGIELMDPSRYVFAEMEQMQRTKERPKRVERGDGKLTLPTPTEPPLDLGGKWLEL